MVIEVMSVPLQCSRLYQCEVQHWFFLKHDSPLSVLNTVTLSLFLFALLVCKSCQLFFGTHCTYLILCLSGVTSESSWTDDPQWRTTNNGSCSSTRCTNHTSCNTEWSNSSTNSGCACLKFAGRWPPMFLCSEINVFYFVHCSASFSVAVTVTAQLLSHLVFINMKI